MDIVKLTTIISVIVQMLTGLVDIHAMTLSMLPTHAVVQQILNIEVFVQFVELIFYVWFIAFNVKPEAMAPIRYFDWVITTPTMLFTTTVFMKYKEYIETAQHSEPLTVKRFISEEKQNIIGIFFCNLCMLVFGYLGETSVIPKSIALIGGFIAFAGSFRIIYKDYASKSSHGRKLYVVLLFVWALYGVAFMLNTVAKNVAYNFLDIVSKNFFGLYLVYTIHNIKPQLQNGASS
jgi:hypothetical protein